MFLGYFEKAMREQDADWNWLDCAIETMPTFHVFSDPPTAGPGMSSIAYCQDYTKNTIAILF